MLQGLTKVGGIREAFRYILLHHPLLVCLRDPLKTHVFLNFLELDRTHSAAFSGELMIYQPLGFLLGPLLGPKSSRHGQCLLALPQILPR